MLECFYLPDQQRPVYETKREVDCLSAAWSPGFFLEDGQRCSLSLEDDDRILRQPMGRFDLVGSADLPSRLDGNPQADVYWSAVLVLLMPIRVCGATHRRWQMLARPCMWKLPSMTARVLLARAASMT